MNCANRTWNRKALGLLLVVSLLGHVALAGWHGGAMAAAKANGELAVSSVTICAGGTLRQVAIKADGSPVTDDAPTLATTCPLCATLGSCSVALDADVVSFALPTGPVRLVRQAGAEQRTGRKPVVRHGHDPPFFS